MIIYAYDYDYEYYYDYYQLMFIDYIISRLNKMEFQFLVILEDDYDVTIQ